MRGARRERKKNEPSNKQRKTNKQIRSYFELPQHPPSVPAARELAGRATVID